MKRIINSRPLYPYLCVLKLLDVVNWQMAGANAIYDLSAKNINILIRTCCTHTMAFSHKMPSIFESTEIGHAFI